MSVDWATIRTAISGWAKTATGLKAAVWREEERPIVDEPIVLLNIVSVRALGVDEERTETDLGAPLGEEVTVRLVGNRIFTVSFAVENYVSQRAAGFAHQYLEVLRGRLRLPTSQAVWQAAGIAIVETRPTVLLDYVFDGRMVSAASMDVVMAAAIDVSDDPVGYIETVEVSSALEDPGGNVLPVPPNLEDEQMP